MESEEKATAEGLALNRSRRVKKDKTGRLAALKKLRESKSTGNRIIYKVSEIENVYDEVNEDVYSDKVQQRLDDDWIVDDGAGDYVEDGREIFDEEMEAPKTKQLSQKTERKTSSKKKIKVVKSSDIKQMLMSSGAKRKIEKNVDLDNDELLGDILKEINSSDPLAKPRSSVVIRKKKSLHTPPAYNYATSPSPSIKPDIMTSPPSALTGRRMKPRKIVPPAPVKMDPCYNSPVKDVDTAPPSKRSKLIVEEDEKSEHGEDPGAQTVNLDDAMQFDVEADGFDTNFDDAAPEQTKSFNSQTTKFSEELAFLGWETNKEKFPETAEQEVIIDSANLPLIKAEDGSEVFRFYWLDAYEEHFHHPGVVYMFGKTFAQSAKRYVSCCVVVKNIDRKIYLLPREKDLQSGCDVSPQDVYHEFNDKVADKNKIMKFKTKIVEKKFAFGDRSIPHTSQYLEITYSAEYRQLPGDLSGNSFRCVFGTNQSSLESLLLERKIKGPCWLDVKSPQSNSASISWSKVEMSVSSPSNLSVATSDDPPPPVVVMSLSMKTIPNLKTHQNEVVGIAGLINDSFPLDKTAPKPAFKKSFFILSKPSDCIFPFDLRDAMKRRGFDIEIMGTERALLCSFLVKLLKIDPDVIIGHDILNFDLDVLLHRIAACKVPHWSKVGRLRKLNMPKLLGGGRFSDRSITCGRLLCDVKTSAKELIRCRSYDLTTLSEIVLKKQRKEVAAEQIKDLFTTSDSLLWLVEHTFMDASFILDIACELNALPLALQITNIAGNVLSRTLLGGRSERNEFLLLHAFHEKDFIPPDKVFKKKEKQEALQEDGETEGRPGKARKKAAYAGGLVLDPKRGFYDKYILLLDFNSLYPSIIQEYNICFTTIARFPDGAEEKVDMDSYIPELPNDNLEMGVLPTEIRKLVQRRKQVKQLMKDPGLSKEKYTQYDIRQKALKLTANSMYGCLGFSNSRFYAKPIAALVTRQGREILMHTKELAQRMGLEVIYGDTDSIMINTNSTDMDHAFKLGHQVKAEVNKLYRLLEIDIDGVYKSLLLLKKKKYAALSVQRLADGTYSTSKELKGLDIVRRDWCDLAKLAGNHAVNQILSDQPREEIVDKIHEKLTEIGTKVRKGEFPTKEFEIRKELTRDPNLYPGKDSLPHVRVALRVNSSMSKRLKAGDIVSYVVCQDGTTNPATHRAYSAEELASKPELSIDSDYYLSQQVHPVVTRLCDPIDGTDAARIAQCLGLDPSGFKQPQTQGLDEEERLMSVLATEEEKFSSCQKFVFVCPGSRKEIVLDRGVITEMGPQWTCSLETSCGDDNQLSKFVNELRNQLTLTIRKHIMKYYQSWMQCDDPACGYRTRFMSSILDRNGPVCTACFKGALRPEITSKSLYQQLSYYRLQFDVEYALSKYKQDGINSKASIKINEYRKQYKSLCDCVDFYLNQSGYSEVSLSTLFNWMSNNKTKQ